MGAPPGCTVRRRPCACGAPYYKGEWGTKGGAAPLRMRGAWAATCLLAPAL